MMKRPLDEREMQELLEWMKSDYLEERGKRGSWDKFQRVLTKVPDVEPEESDRL